MLRAARRLVEETMPVFMRGDLDIDECLKIFASQIVMLLLGWPPKAGRFMPALQQDSDS